MTENKFYKVRISGIATPAYKKKLAETLKEYLAENEIKLQKVTTTGGGKTSAGLLNLIVRRKEDMNKIGRHLAQVLGRDVNVAGLEIFKSRTVGGSIRTTAKKIVDFVKKAYKHPITQKYVLPVVKDIYKNMAMPAITAAHPGVGTALGVANQVLGLGKRKRTGGALKKKPRRTTKRPHGGLLGTYYQN